MPKRQVFFSFHYDNDIWRANQIKNMGRVDNSSTFSCNDWEEVKRKTDIEIMRWIDSQLTMRTCLVVLIGEKTAGRKWINYEIKKAYEMGKGIVGIYIHKLKNIQQSQSRKGGNPFVNIYTKNFKCLSNYVTCFDSTQPDSINVRMDISNNIERLIENAIENRGTY